MSTPYFTKCLYMSTKMLIGLSQTKSSVRQEGHTQLGNGETVKHVKLKSY